MGASVAPKLSGRCQGTPRRGGDGAGRSRVARRRQHVGGRSRDLRRHRARSGEDQAGHDRRRRADRDPRCRWKQARPPRRRQGGQTARGVRRRGEEAPIRAQGGAGSGLPRRDRHLEVHDALRRLDREGPPQALAVGRAARRTRRLLARRGRVGGESPCRTESQGPHRGGLRRQGPAVDTRRTRVLRRRRRAEARDPRRRGGACRATAQ